MIADRETDLRVVIGGLLRRHVTDVEIYEGALQMSKSTYYKRIKDGDPWEPSDAFRLADYFHINPMELLVLLGLISGDQIDTYIDNRPRTMGKKGQYTFRGDKPPL